MQPNTAKPPASAVGSFTKMIAEYPARYKLGSSGKRVMSQDYRPAEVEAAIRRAG